MELSNCKNRKTYKSVQRKQNQRQSRELVTPRKIYMKGEM